MLTCSDYEGRYEVKQSGCSQNCTLPTGSTIEIQCGPPATFVLDTGTGPVGHHAEVNAEGQLVVSGLELVTSVTGTAPSRYLFGVSDAGAMMAPEPEVWGAEQQPG